MLAAEGDARNNRKLGRENASQHSPATKKSFRFVRSCVSVAMPFRREKMPWRPFSFYIPWRDTLSLGFVRFPRRVVHQERFLRGLSNRASQESFPRESRSFSPTMSSKRYFKDKCLSCHLEGKTPREFPRRVFQQNPQDNFRE